jgi:DNA-binding PadR family transcriptional regulator
MAIAYAILASLMETPCSGYDLAKRFDGSVGFFWHATHQQIYRELSKLEDQGWVCAEKIAQEGRPDKKRYSITEVGQQQLANWIAQPSELSALKDEFLVKVFAGYIVPTSTLLNGLEQYRQAHSQRLKVYRQIEQQFFANPDHLSQIANFQYLTLRCGIRQEEAWIKWCDEVEQTLKK